jgi:hypothetical protein
MDYIIDTMAGKNTTSIDFLNVGLGRYGAAPENLQEQETLQVGELPRPR